MTDDFQELRAEIRMLREEAKRLSVELEQTPAAARAADCFLAETASNIAGVVKPLALDALAQNPNLEVNGRLHASYEWDFDAPAMTRQWVVEVGEAYQREEPAKA